jgi:hypothetical protein
VAKILGILLDEVGTFPASFIEGYELSPLMKASKALLKETETKDLDSYHEVWKRMKTAHGEGKKTMPDKFRPTKRKPAKTLATKNEDPKDKMVPVTVSREKTLVSASRKEKLIDTQDPPSSQEGPSIPIPRRGVTIMDDMSSRSDTKAANPGRIPPKPERKSFTLGSLMRSNPKDGEKTDTSVSAHSSGKASASAKTKQLPSWIIGSSTLEVPTDTQRAFALDFIREMATHFPAGKINVETFALSLEAAIFQWASKKDNWQDDYWDTVHCLVAAIAGKRDPGSLMSFVMEGHFTTPKELVLLPEKLLADSFEGRPLFFDQR